MSRSSSSSVDLIEVPLRQSRLLSVAFVAVHIAGAAPLFYLSLPISVVMLWLAALSLSLGGQLLRQPVSLIRRLPDGRWRLTYSDREVDADLVHWFAHPWLCVVVFRSGWRFQRSFAIPCWLMESETHRRLRVVLRST